MGSPSTRSRFDKTRSDKTGRGFLDSAIARLSPVWALRRAQARRALAYYEAARPDPYRKQRREIGSGDEAVRWAGQDLREQARHLEQNHDLARGALNILVANIIGPAGITVEPQPRRTDGSIHDELARAIGELRRHWNRRPEVTWSHDWPSAERLLARSWVRDGEVFAQHVMGTAPWIDHGSRVPYSIEMLEADFVPMDYDDIEQGIIQGVRRNAWGRPLGYYVYRQHPGGRTGARRDYIAIPAERMAHLKLIDRIRQGRGVSVFASVLGRLDDIKDVEESERIAAKVAASMAAVIRKGSPDLYTATAFENGQTAPRELKFRPGMIFDDLLPGEDISLIDTKRPNTGLEAFRKGQLRAGASGIGITYSSWAKDYDGTYSSQRQELVEGWSAYGVMQAEFINGISRPVHENLIALAIASGELIVPSDVVPETVDDALYIGPQMPWIDPESEAAAWEVLERNRYASGPEIIRRRGQNPADVLEQEAKWQRAIDKAGLPAPGTSASTDRNANAPSSSSGRRPFVRTNRARDARLSR
jgi:lambda family phage portal protein